MYPNTADTSCRLILWSTALLKKLTVAQLVNKFLVFLAKRRPLPYSQKPASEHYFEPDESSSHPHIVFL
jgi:hypothetical protein